MIKFKYLKWSIVGAFLLYFIIKGTIESSHAACDVLKLFRDYKFDGLIINKYIDNPDHATKKVIIKNFNTLNTDTLALLDWDTTGFYYKININDTIIKDIGSNSVRLNNGKGKFFYILDFGCDKEK